MTTGLAAFAATAANAANNNASATNVSINPAGDSATVGTCNPFTATVTPTPAASDNYTVTVVLSQQAPAAPAPATTTGFCDTTNFTPAASYPNPQNQPTGTQQTPPPAICPPGGQTGGPSAPSPAPATTVTCQGNFSTQNGSGQVTFGVISNNPGTESVQVYVDKNRNGVFDNGIDTSTTVTKTWNANTAGSIACTPPTQSKPASPGATATFNCTVTTGAGGAGTPATGQDVKFHITAGPDADAPAALGHQCSDTPDPNNQANKGDTYTCQVTNVNGITGTDDITAWVDLDHNGGIGTNEPTAAPVHVVWVNPAPNGATLSVTCDKNVVATTTAGGNTSTLCQDPLSDKSVKFTASVKSGVNSTNPVVGTLVTWAITQNNPGTNEPASDAETLDNSSCTTGSDGTCSVTLTNGTPTEGENIQVTATVKTANGGTVQATGTKQWHNPTPQEARNVTVAPAHATQVPGGAQSFTAAVTDRFGNPVSGSCVGWSESGPGRLNNVQQFNCSDANGNQFDTTCLTGATGQCTIEVTSLSTESGTETVTASIQTANGNNGSGSAVPFFGGPNATYECNSAAGFSYFNDPNGNPGNYNPGGTTPNANGANNVATGASAGACTASGTVTWQKSVTPPPAKTRITAHINCHVPTHHRHRLRCRVQENPVRSGLRVKFKRLVHGHKAFLGSDFTNSHGRAHLFLTHLKKGHTYRVFAHVYATTRTTGATTNTVRIRIG
jgi:hypothetical protein